MDKLVWNLQGVLFQREMPIVMGIINLNGDSFHASSRATQVDEVLRKADQMIAEGADILDLGAASSRPGSEIIPLQEELDRLIPAIEELSKHAADILVSVDTWRAEVAKEAVQAGARMINDISGGKMDKNMFQTVSDLNVPYVLMHMPDQLIEKLGNADAMQTESHYNNVVSEVVLDLHQQALKAEACGVSDIILDPGFGFGKTLEENYQLLTRLRALVNLGYPVLAGLSRKSMIRNVLDIETADALNGTTALNMLALDRGAIILRVHDVQQAKEVALLSAAMHH